MKTYYYEHLIDKIQFYTISKNENRYAIIVKGIAHNNQLFNAIGDELKKYDITYLVRQSWWHSDQIFKDGNEVIDKYKLDKSKFIFLHNTSDELERGKKFGFEGIHCNANCFQDESKYVLNENVTKKYNAVYVARYDKCKQHWLVPDRNDITLVALTWPKDIGNTFKNCIIKERLSAKQISEIVNESNYGLCLSAEEGQCRAAIEYLYCGVPIVTVPSRGGRDVWYTKDNQIIVNNKNEIEEVLNSKIQRFDRQQIRSNAIQLANMFRQNLYGLLKLLGFDTYNNLYKFNKGSPQQFIEGLK